jgi:hypothetical protein
VGEVSAGVHIYDELFNSLARVFEARGHIQVEPETEINIFNDENKLHDVGAIIDKSSRYLSRDDALENFRASGFDTVANYTASLSEFSKPYEDKIGENFLRRRITALRFLELSQHLKSSDCFDLMDELVVKLGQHSDEKLQRNSKLDLYELSQVCGRIDKNIAASFANSLNNKRARNTILLGIKRITDE